MVNICHPACGNHQGLKEGYLKIPISVRCRKASVKIIQNPGSGSECAAIDKSMHLPAAVLRRMHIKSYLCGLFSQKEQLK